MAAKERAELERDSSREQVAAALKSRDRHRVSTRRRSHSIFQPTMRGHVWSTLPCSTVEAVEAARVRFRDPESGFSQACASSRASSRREARRTHFGPSR